MLDPDISTIDAARLLHTDEPLDRATLDRRRFLQLIGMGVGAGLVSGGTGSPARLVRRCARSVGVGRRPAHRRRGHPRRDVHVRRQRRPQHRRPVERRQLLHAARRPGARPVADAADRPATTGSTRRSPRSSASGTTGRWRSSRASATRTPTSRTSRRWRTGWQAAVRRIPSTGWIGRWLDGYLGGEQELYAAAEVGSLAAAPPARERAARHRGAGRAARLRRELPSRSTSGSTRRCGRCIVGVRTLARGRSARHSSINSTWRRRCRRTTGRCRPARLEIVAPARDRRRG